MKRIRCLLLVCLLAGSLTGCGGETRQTCFVMNTVVQLQLWGRDGEAAAKGITGLLQALDARWSAEGDSVLGKLNRGEAPQLSSEEEALLRQVEALSRRTGGAFDPKLHSVSMAWGFWNQNYRVPTPEELSAALADPQWDLGAALKGYAGSRAAALLEEMQVERALLNLGGNVQTYGRKSDGTPWKIGIRNPDGGANLGVVAVNGTMAVVTSGDYQRFFEKDGVKYHHILDPKTGCPADSGLRSVTVICADGLTADGLSTGLYVMGLEKAAAFWRESRDFEAVFVTREGKIYATQGANLSDCVFEVIRREN